MLERDRTTVATCLVAVSALAWAWLWWHARMDMSMPEGMTMAPPLLYLFVMWWIMMVAMMLPSAAPMILLFGAVHEKQRAQGKPYVPTAVFASTYLVIWGLFSVAAAGLQWWIESRIEPVMATGLSSAQLSGALLFTAGIYQLTPLKNACLRQCQAPLQFLLTSWRPGLRGAVTMGLQHGTYCVGCCWLLMGLLFVGGVMNLRWVIGISLYVLLEKLLPTWPWLGRVCGLALAVAGIWLLLGSV